MLGRNRIAFFSSVIFGVMLAIPGVMSAEIMLTFHVPAQGNGDVQGDRFDWALLLFSEKSDLEGHLRAPDGGNVINDTYLHYGTSNSLSGSDMSYSSARRISSESERWAGSDAEISPTNGWGSVFVQADVLNVEVFRTEWEIQLTDPKEFLWNHVPDGVPMWTYRNDRMIDESTLVVPIQGDDESSFNLNASGHTTVEWHNLEVACDTASCIDGGHPNEWGKDWGLAAAKATAAPFIETSLTNGSFNLTGKAFAVVLGGTDIDLDFTGASRYPLASTNGDCDGCTALDRQTLTLNGTIFFDNLKDAGEGRVQGTARGSAVNVLVDETTVPPESFFGTRHDSLKAAGLGGVLLAILWIFWNGRSALLLLLGRINYDNALKNSTRARIFEIARTNPGATIEVLVNESGISRSSAEHHVRILCRIGRLVEREGRPRRYFENHGKFTKQKQALYALMSEPEASQLMNLISGCGSIREADITETMAGWDWAASTTKWRLRRLAKHGLLSTWKEKNERWYSIDNSMINIETHVDG